MLADSLEKLDLSSPAAPLYQNLGKVITMTDIHTTY
jgi:hypothetical protein